MTRAAWLLLALLIASNGAWLAFREPSSGDGAAAPPPPDLVRELEVERENVVRLREKIEELERPAKQAATAREARRARKPPEPDPDAQLTGEAWKLGNQWAADALQVDDAAKRAETIATLRLALASGDPVRELAALRALPRLYQLDFDKAPFRPLIRPHFASARRPICAAAVWALRAVGIEPGDLDLLLSLRDDPPPSYAHALASYSKGEISEPVEEALLEILSSDDPGVLKDSFNGLGSKLTPRLEERVLELARDPRFTYDAVYFCLRGLSVKSEAVTDFLIEQMKKPGGELGYWAAWGLGFGVVKEAQPRVADLFLAHFESRADSHYREQCLRTLRQYGTEKHRDALQRFADNPMVTEQDRKNTLDAIKAIDVRLARQR